MNKNWSKINLLATSALAFGAVTAPAIAQESDAASDGDDVVVVTAQRREQNIRDVPLAIDAIGGDQIQVEGIEDVQRLAEELPSLVVGGQSNTFGSLNISIRGVGSQVGDPAVGFYVDEVFQANASGFVTQFLDVERVEVLKGPQGTLWGRNTTGGAVHYVTKDPVLDDFGVEAYAEVGWYDSLDFGDVPIRKFGGAINVPLGEKAALRVSAAKVDQDNYTLNLELPEPEKNQDAISVRADLLFEPTDNFDVQFGFSLIDDPFHNAFTLKNRPFPGSAVASVVDLISDVSIEPDNFRVRSNASPVADFRETGYRLEANWDVADNWTLRSISSYKHLTQDRNADLDGTQVTIVHNESQQDHEWWSQEAQVLYNSDRFNFIGGFYYFGEEFSQNSQTTAQNSLFFVANCNNNNTAASAFAAFCPLVNGTDPVLPDGILDFMPILNGGMPIVAADFLPGGLWDLSVNTVLGASPFTAPFIPVFLASSEAVPVTTISRDFETSSIAVYGQGSYALTETLTATAGIRWTEDDKTINTSSVAAGTPSGATLDDKFSAVTPKFGLEWRPADDILTYASVTRGFKSGTLNLFAGGLVAGEQIEVAPEKVWAYEIGFKGGFAGNRLLIDGAVFYYDYTDYQLQVQFPEGPRLFNIPEVEIKGFEAAAILNPVEPLSLGVSLSVVDAEVASDVLGINPVDIAAGAVNLNGRTLPRVPDFKLTANADYTFDLGAAGSITAGGSINHSDVFFNDIFNDFPAGEYTTFNANIRYASENGNFWVNVFGRNLSNEEYQTGNIFTDSIGEVQFFAPPRTIGVQVGAKF